MSRLLHGQQVHYKCNHMTLDIGMLNNIFPLAYQKVELSSQALQCASKRYLMLTNNAMLIISGCDTTKLVGI